MPVGMWSAKIYGYDLPWRLCDVGNFDWFFSVLLCGHLAFIAFAIDLFYDAVHWRKPVLSIYWLGILRSTLALIMCGSRSSFLAVPQNYGFG